MKDIAIYWFMTRALRRHYFSSSSSDSVLWIFSYEANTIAPVGITFRTFGRSPL